MKTFTKHILLLALMLFGVAGAAWASRAPQKFTGPVAFTDLVQGDTLAPGFSLICNGESKLRFPEGTVKVNGSPRESNLVLNCSLINNLTYGSNGAMLVGSDAVTPVYGGGQDGNAWVVTSASNSYVNIVGIYIAPDPTVPALDELTGHWNFLMPGSNKLVKAVLLDSIVVGPHVRVGDLAVEGKYANGTDTVYYYDTTSHSSLTLMAAANDGQGRNFGYWADLDPTDDLYSDYYRYIGSSRFTCGDTFRAVYPNNYTLTLDTPQGGGTLELAGMTYDTVYNITFVHSDHPGDNRTITVSSLPYDTTFDYGSAYVDDAYASEPSGKLSKIAQGAHAVTIRISGAFEGTGSYGCRVEGFDIWTITCTASTVPVTPYGITKIDDNTYSVMEGLTVNVTATPDSAHYLAHIGSTDTVSNYACGYSFVMPSNDYPLLADFQAKPTLTLDQTDGGTLEAIVPQGGATAMHLTTDQIPTWPEVFEPVMEADLQPFGFVAVDSAAAAAWTGAPASGQVLLLYAPAGNKFKAILFQNGQWHDAYNASFNKADFYTNSDRVYFTTGATRPNVIASSTPNTYYIDYGTPVTVVATPDSAHYLVSFSDDDPATERNSNIAVEKTYDSVIADLPLTATFNEIPVLTLASNNSEWGTVELDGVTPGPTTYNITIGGDTYTNVTFPFTTTVFIHEGLEWVETAEGDQYPLSVSKNGNNAVINISAPYDGARTILYEYFYDDEPWVVNKNIICRAVQDAPTTPEGVTYAGYNTYLVLPGTTLTVTATPDSAHYFVNWDEETALNSNTAVEKTLTMGTDDTELTANFSPKPTLTLAHNDGGEMEAIVPQGGALTSPFSVPGEWTANGTLVKATANLPGDFQPVGDPVALAWQNTTGQKVLLFFGGDEYSAKYIKFQADGSIGSINDNGISKNSVVGLVVDSSYQVRYTTGIGNGNVTASTEPNTYYIDYNTSVTVKATPSDTAYLVRFDEDADTNSNVAVEKTYGPLTAALTTAEATFNAKPVLTLAASDTSWGKVMLGGATYDTVYTITIDGEQHIVRAADMPYDTTFDYLNGYEGYDQSVNGGNGNVTLVEFGPTWTNIRISGAFDGQAEYYCTVKYAGLDYGEDHRNISCTASTVPVLPAGVAQLDSVTYRVDYGAEVTVQADATELHHVANWEDQNGDSLQTAAYSAYFVTEPEPLFPDSSSLTFTVTADTMAKALFGINSYDVAAMAQLDERAEIGTGVAMGTVQATYRDIQGDAQSVAADDTITYTAQGASISTLVATPFYGYLFSQWTDTTGKKVFGTTDTLRLDSANVVVARFVPDTFAVATDLNVERMGTVTGAGRYPYLTQVTLEGVSEYGYHFDRWNDFDTNNPRTVQLVQDTAFKAFFDYDQFRVRTSSANDTMGSAIANLGTDFYCNYLYTTTFVATPATGYHFVQWSNGLTTDTARIVIVQDTVMVAFFAPNKYTVTALSANSTMGSTSGSGVYDYGTTATLVATAKTGYSFAGWSDGVTTAERTITIDFTHDTTVTANFTVNQYTVTVESADTVMGSVSGTATVDYNTRTSISATANEHYHFVKWNDGVTSATRTVTVREDVTYTATFAPDMYTITGLADQGQGSVTGSGSYAYLTNATLTATPACGYLFDHWSNLSTESSITVQVTGNETYTAFFRPSAVEVVHDTIELHDTTVVEIHDTTVVAVDTMYIPVPDTTLVPVVINDTTIVPVDIFDTTVVPVTWYDTTRVDVTWYDTTVVPVTIVDTTLVPVVVPDTTFVPVTVYDTTIVPVTIVDTTLVPVVVPDTTFVPVTVYDTTVVPVTDYDTTVVPVTWYDTTVVPVTWYDTTLVPVTVMDTTVVPVTEYDTTHVDVTVVDSTLVPIHDTVIEYVEVHDTLWLVEYIYDTVYIHDTIFVGIDDVDALDAKIYANNGQIVVEGADGNKVVLYDVTGRILATKVDEYAPLRFDIPVSGTYLVKIGNHAARRIVMIR